MNRKYTVKAMDKVIKVTLRLIDKFKPQLVKEYGASLSDTMNMLDILYKEQCEKMPLAWYEYACESKE